jgi:DNA-binding beta-propeller fold protein YncE
VKERLPDATASSGAAAAILAIAVFATTALAQAPATPSPAVAALEKAVAADPSEAVLTYLLSVMRARAGDAPGAIGALEQTLANGDGFLPPDDLFENMQSNRAFRDLRARFARKLPRVVTGHVVATLSDAYLIPEGIAYDEASETLYVGSIARRAIFRVGPRGKVAPVSIPSDELDFVLGIAIDDRTRRLYAVSTSALTDAGRTRPRNAIVMYDLRSNRRERSYPVPAAVQLNDVAIADAFVLATDSASGAVYRIALADGNVDALVPPGRAPGANGIAITGDGRAYVGASRRPCESTSRPAK